jgi:DNA-binding IclR family transcriptional regulator
MPEHRAPAASRAIRALKVLARSREPLGVNAVARELGVVPSSCLHILRALVDEGLVQVDPVSKRYSLGLGILTLAHDMLGKDHFVQLVQPELARLVARYPVTATAVELDDRERMVVVAVEQSPALYRLEVGVGNRFPAFISATGRCVAARSTLSRSQLRQRFNALQWQAPPKFEDWYREVEAVRQTGIAVDHGNYICGITIVASLVDGPDGPRRAISIVSVSEQMPEKKLASLKRDTLAAAQRISAQLHQLGRGAIATAAA